MDLPDGPKRPRAPPQRAGQRPGGYPALPSGRGRGEFVGRPCDGPALREPKLLAGPAVAHKHTGESNA